MLIFEIGKLHPLIVHLPIGILLVAFLMEIASRWKRFESIKPAISFVIGIAVLSTIVATFTGWILPKEGNYDEALVGKHFWFAVGLTIGVILLFLFERNRHHDTWGKFYFPFFILNVLILSITGHYGGSLTHGSNYLFEDSHTPTITVKDVNELQAYQEVIYPIIKKKCVSCHNPQKKKGDLLMTSVEAIKKGGKEGPLLIAGNAKESALLQRVHLEKVEKKHMPPNGKAQLTNNEIKLLTWWIDQGATFTDKVGQLKKDDQINAILKSYEVTETSRPSLPAASPKQIKSLSSEGFSIALTGPESTYLSVAMTNDTTISKSKLQDLKKIAKHIQSLDLSFSNVNSDMLGVVSKMVNLENLRLQHTNVDHQFLKKLKNHKALKYLNLYQTPIGDEAIPWLLNLKGLKNLYLWNTKITLKGVEQLQSKMPALKVIYQVAEGIFDDVKLNPPIIDASGDIFEDTMGIALNVNLKDAQIYYTLDGSIPDSTSNIYTERIIIDQVTTLKAISRKKGWASSEVNEKAFTKATYAIEHLKLNQSPSPKYPGKGKLTLTDYEKGSSTFSDGKWLGYEGEHLIATIDLKQKERISNIAVGALEDPASYIFYPKAIFIHTSENGRDYRLKTSMQIPIATEPHPSEVHNFILEFEEIETRFIRVEIKSNLTNPDWHPAPGAKCWIFIDEILVN